MQKDFFFWNDESYVSIKPAFSGLAVLDANRLIRFIAQ